LPNVSLQVGFVNSHHPADLHHRQPAVSDLALQRAARNGQMPGGFGQGQQH
jgi:hypothetical protein